MFSRGTLWRNTSNQRAPLFDLTNLDSQLEKHLISSVEECFPEAPRGEKLQTRGTLCFPICGLLHLKTEWNFQKECVIDIPSNLLGWEVAFFKCGQTKYCH